MRFLVEEKGVPRVVSNVVSGFSDARGADAEFTLFDRDFLQAVVEHKRVLERYPKQFSVDASVIGGCLFRWPRMIRQLRDNPGQECRERVSCPAPQKSMAIRADGAILLCNHLPGLVLGWVGKDRLADIWRNSPTISHFCESTVRRVDRFPQCAGCRWAPYCTPECPASVDNISGQGRIATDSCLRHYMEIAPDFDFEAMEWT